MININSITNITHTTGLIKTKDFLVTIIFFKILPINLQKLNIIIIEKNRKYLVKGFTICNPEFLKKI